MRHRKSLAELERERGRLLERIASQRGQLSVEFVPVQHLLQFGERVAQTAQAARNFVQNHPWAMGTFGALLVLRRPRSIGRWVKRGLLAWRTWRTARNLLQAIQRQLNRTN
ncbi:YqjK family protein [Pseudorhodoferax sp.]|uniref:YqjK family protein n=1 Tax=Pseudorhodoferax sp. TaxID=1993553 RepID=UPI002DD6A6D6|nr:YqjK family protein [Pseudorhodoferax sp.]